MRSDRQQCDLYQKFAGVSCGDAAGVAPVFQVIGYNLAVTIFDSPGSREAGSGNVPSETGAKL